ncbi:MAG: hypothetical protein JNL67_02540 [Planctomycetaceae bacterium]|nr:hypothetical protein [Planctomycetaceae bacterium]
MNRSIPPRESFKLTTGSRLHFGLFRFAPKPIMAGHAATDRSLEHPRDLQGVSDQAPWFGGLGLMIQDPATSIAFAPETKFVIQDDATGRVIEFAERWFRSAQSTQATKLVDIRSVAELPVRVSVQLSPPQHSGLGAGTQLALAVGQGLTKFFFDMELAPQELAQWVGRGLRSAIGTHGFFRGGLIVDRGKLHSQELGTLDGAFQLPDAWRVVLITRNDPSVFHGSRELQAFRDLPEIPSSSTQKLQQLAREVILPAVWANDHDAFAQAIYEYGWIAGNCFAQIQGGPFASSRAEWWVAHLRKLGFPGIGQSSWGPTLYCFAPDPDRASWLAARVSDSLQHPSESVLVTRPQVGPYQIDPL